MDRVDKRTKSELEHAFVEFCDRAKELGFKFQSMSAIELVYIKGEAALSPNNILNRIKLYGDDFMAEEEPEEELVEKDVDDDVDRFG